MTSHSKYKLIGGEYELANDGRYYGVTNSGRSSLRWLIQSMHLQGKRVLVPDFVCQIVVDVMHEYDIEILFYPIQDDFEFFDPVLKSNADALYLIKYFGHQSYSFNKFLKSSKIPVIIDDVFGVEAPSVSSDVDWGYFNSFRKISEVSDFSQLVTNFPLKKIERTSLPGFSNMKYKAKRYKSDFIRLGLGSEDVYLKLFSESERILDTNNGVFCPEDKSVFLANCFFRNLAKLKYERQRNLEVAKKTLSKHHYVDINPDFPSFLPLKLFDRDQVRKELMEKSIFLAVHWPEVQGINNKFSNKIISLPLDSRYTIDDIRTICLLIEELDR